MSGVKIVLLCEDKNTATFVRKFLRHRNFKEHDFTILAFAAGKGSGEQRVKKEYPKQLKHIREARRKGRNAYLIVVIDADTGTIEDRHNDLKEACTDPSRLARGKDKDIPAIPPISPRNEKTDKNVLHIIPRRNIETWFAYLDNQNVDESTDYKNKIEACATKIREYADNLFDMCHHAQSLRDPAPPSLQEACKEYRKLKRTTT